jgi:hypothetical protein
MSLGSRDYYRILPETTRDNLEEKTTEQLEQYYRWFAELRSNLTDPIEVDVCKHRMNLLLSEIQTRRMEAHSERQHLELLGIGKKTLGVGKKSLCWSRVAGVAGIVASVAGIAAVIVAVLSLIYQIYTSRTPRATSPQASPQSSSQSPTPTNVSPQEISSTPAPSPQQAATSQPSVNPPES